MISLKKIYEETKPKYLIFCDMDGVLVDFDKGYKDLTGKPTHHADVQDKNDFWRLLDKSLEEKNLTEYDYWVNLPWMKDGKQLWNHIKNYTPYILTAPSLDPGSKQGKREWVKKELDGAKAIYFRKASLKPEFSGKNRILIDDREDTIEAWRAKGGIGIHHSSTSTTIEQLKKLGL